MAEYSWTYTLFTAELGTLSLTFTAAETDPGVYAISTAYGYIGVPSSNVYGLSSINGADNLLSTGDLNGNYLGFDSRGVSVTYTSIPSSGVFQANVQAVTSIDGAGQEVQALTVTLYGVNDPVGHSYAVTNAFVSGGPPPSCFVAGTMIATPGGEVAVEALRPGDLILTYGGEAKPARWIGRSVVRPERRKDARNFFPVRIRCAALAPGMPVRDLVVSPGHALLLDDVLVNACDLINEATIVQERANVVNYYHVELDTHDILLAEGAPCETYLEEGNRGAFVNGGDVPMVLGQLDRSDDARTCFPVVRAGKRLDAIRVRLSDRASKLGWHVVTRTELRLQVGHHVIYPAVSVGNRHWFNLTTGNTGQVRLISNAARIGLVRPGVKDERCLGVSLVEVRVDGCQVDLASTVFGSGFYAVEKDDDLTWRWTDGNATLELGPASILELCVHDVAPTYVRDECLQLPPHLARRNDV